VDRLRQRITEAARRCRCLGWRSPPASAWRSGGRARTIWPPLRPGRPCHVRGQAAGRNRVFDGEELDPPPWHEAQRAAMPDNRAMTTRLNKHRRHRLLLPPRGRSPDRRRRVTVNGHPAGTGAVVGEEDQVLVDGQPLRARGPQARRPPPRLHRAEQAGRRHLHHRNSVKGNIVDFVGHEQRIFPIGRLDKDSEGLILMTSNGDIVNQILRAENGHQKEYLVAVNKPVTDEFLRGMARGVRIHDQMTLPCKTSRIAKFGFRITLQQGLNRQIRLMAAEFGYRVTQLRRVRIDNIKIGALKPGQWRNLTEQELQGLLPKQLDW
jgi:23S rRNA pseudouridine2604 synthase